MTQTTNLNLPIFQPNDVPSWLQDWNGAMNKIDAHATTVNNAISQAVAPMMLDIFNTDYMRYEWVDVPFDTSSDDFRMELGRGAYLVKFLQKNTVPTQITMYNRDKSSILGVYIFPAADSAHIETGITMWGWFWVPKFGQYIFNHSQSITQGGYGIIAKWVPKK